METKEVRVRGTVQGVGFRPTVWRLAHTHGLVGEVLNDAEGVLIRISGPDGNIANFLECLVTEAPPLARIAALEVQTITARPYPDFKITRSTSTGGSHTQVSMDAATCKECLAEIQDPQHRRYLYPFTNCTHCGPRLSIVTGIPYDRDNTTMSGFPMCAACRGEYEDPADRRFHAQPIACHLCGPQIWLGPGKTDAGSDAGVPEAPRHATLYAAMAHTRQCLDMIEDGLRAGKIVALRGLGGFHLCCDATSDLAVKHLRERKHRYAKPFALMAHDLAAVDAYCDVSAVEAAQLQSPRAPIVLLQQRDNSGADARLSAHVAPGSSLLGFMLPYTPLHFLIAARFAKPLVMTSGNFSDEPQIIDNHTAQQKLARIADLVVYHNRDIANRIDDSVVRCMGERPRLLRRARGFAPQSIALPQGFEQAPDLLAFGGELKATFCLLKDGAAVLSQHQGDLEDVGTCEDYEKNLKLYEQLYQHKPRYLVADKHPEYLSSKLAQQQLERCNPDFPLQLITVQHHHAHIASCMAENQLPLGTAPVLGVALDGLGFGEDDTIWGGEFLLADYRSYRRLGCLKPVAMIGGAQAIHEPWRNTYAHIVAGMGWAAFTERFGASELHAYLKSKPLDMLDQMLRQRLNTPHASSCGRLFDAVAAALGLCRDRAQFEGQGAIELEMLVDEAPLQRMLGSGSDRESAYPFAVVAADEAMLSLDPQPMWLSLFTDLGSHVPPQVIATRFHAGLINGIAAMVGELREQHAFDTVALSGGCLQNRFLLEGLSVLFEARGFDCLTQAQVPANDGGLSLGQAAIGAALALASGAHREARHLPQIQQHQKQQHQKQQER